MSQFFLQVPHIQQKYRGDCLAASAAMVLAYLNVTVSYRRVLNALQVNKSIGTGFFHIKELTRFDVTVHYEQGILTDLQTQLQKGNPCIVPVATKELPYWTEDTDHAIVIVGISKTHIIANDPAFSTPSVMIPLGDFDLAWLERDERYAFLTP